MFSNKFKIVVDYMFKIVLFKMFFNLLNYKKNAPKVLPAIVNTVKVQTAASNAHFWGCGIGFY